MLLSENQTCLTQFYSNKKAKQTLVNFITDGRLPHAILLDGPQGCGKTLFARLIACAALCSREKEARPCGQCRACRLILTDAHPDVALFSPDDPGKPYAVSALREMILSCYVLPNDGDKKVYILRDIHQMSEQAQNTLLKIIEEPPPHVMFLLTCQNRAQVLPTILSRVVPIMITTCTVQECAQALQSRLPQLGPQECFQAARLADGNIGRALQILQDETLSKVYHTAQKAAQLICFGDEFELLCLLRPVTKKKEDFLALLTSLEELFVEVVKQKNSSGSEIFLPDAIMNRITTLQAAQIIDIIRKVQSELVQNVGTSLACAQLCGQCKQALQ